MLRNQLFHYTNNSLATHKVEEKLPPEYPDDSCFLTTYVLKPQARVIGCWTSKEQFYADIWFTMGLLRTYSTSLLKTPWFPAPSSWIFLVAVISLIDFCNHESLEILSP